MIYLRSFIFYIGYLSSGVLASVVACLIGPFIGLNQRLKLFSLWPRFANWFLHATCNIKVEIIGKENLPKEPCVIVSNHQGQWETFSMQYLFHPLSTLLKRELLFIPLWGWAIGMYVLLFPEGTRVKAGRVGKYARSSFELAKRNQVKVLPLCHNSGDCWPAHRFIKKPGTITLHIGKPFYVENSKQSAEDVRAWVEKNLN